MLCSIGGGGGGGGYNMCAVNLVLNNSLRSAYTGRLPADLSHATRMNMGKSSVIV